MTFNALERCLKNAGKAFSPKEANLLRRLAEQYAQDGANALVASQKAVKSIAVVYKANLEKLNAHYEEMGAVMPVRTGSPTKLSENYAPPEKGKRARWSVGLTPDGNEDLLSVIEQLGGIRVPSATRNSGGELNGFAETFNTGMARLLRRTNATASTVDQLLGELPSYGYTFDTPDQLYSAVLKAMETRRKVHKNQKTQAYENAFDEAFLGNEQKKPMLRAGKPVTIDDLGVGDSFEVNGEKFTVKNVDEDGNVTIKDGITRTIPPDTVVYPDRGEVKPAKRDATFAPTPPKNEPDPRFGPRKAVQPDLIPEGDIEMTLDGGTQADPAYLLKQKEEQEAAKKKLEDDQIKIPEAENTPKRNPLLPNRDSVLPDVNQPKDTPASPAPAGVKKPSRFGGKRPSAETQKLGDDIFGAPAENTSNEKYGKKFGTNLAKANQFVDTIVRDFPDVTSREMLAAYIEEFFPNAKPYSEALFRNLGSAIDVDETGGIDSWDSFYTPADETPSTQPPPTPPPAPLPKSGTIAERSLEAAKLIEARINTNPAEMTWRELFALTDQAFGGTQADGTYTVKDAYDALETAVNRYILVRLPMPVDGSVPTALNYIQELNTLLSRIPTQTKRSQEQDRMQQFSTPPPLSFVANWVANLNENDIYLEPSAGVGGLAVFAKSIDVGAIIANELSMARSSILNLSDIPDVVITENAEVLHAIVNNKIARGDLLRPTVVVMNPPFSNSTAGVLGDTMVGARHIMEALKILPPGGRLVAIVGEGMAMDKPTFRVWWKDLGTKYNVRANIHVDGKNYTKYGTSFGVQLVVIDKPLANEVVGVVNPIVAEVDLIEQLPNLLEGIRNDRKPIKLEKPETPADKPSGGKPPTGNRPKLDAPRGPTSPRTGDGGSPRGGSPAANGGAANQNPSVPTASTPPLGDVPDAGRPDGGDAGGRSVTDSGRASSEQPAGVDPADADSAPQGNEDDEVYSDYTPTKVASDGSQKHPTPLVESAAMASVAPPDPTYKPDLPRSVIENSLSHAQLENVVYAGQAHQKFAPTGERRGYFIGDGTGVGKGRQIAAIILDNLRQGRKKAVWVSKSSNLIADAKRDMADTGLDPERIHLFNKVAKSGRGGITMPGGTGIVFSTYQTLSGDNSGFNADGELIEGLKKSRIQQLVDWLGKDFDGVIAFDEAHQAGNSITMKSDRGKKGASLMGMAVVDLQRALPKARVVYVSATGATEVSNLAYAERLGIWGPGTPFPNKLKFIQEMAAGGVSAMEIIARDLKALGSYLARTLSFRGIQYDRVEQTLTTDQRTNYDKIAEGWQTVFQNMDQAMTVSGASQNQQARRNARGKFFGSQQRFFNQLLTAMTMPAVIKDAKKHIEDGKSVVFQLTNTNKAGLDRELARLDEEESDSLDSLDLSPKDILLQYVANSFPTAKWVEVADENGEPGTTKWIILKDNEGNIIEDPEAVELKNKTLNSIADLQMPENPIEMILNTFGSENVAEITGRDSRVVRKTTDEGAIKLVLEKGRSDRTAQVEAQDFQDGKRRLLIFSGKGGTGFSYHASRKAKNQQQRIHYLVQAGWRADMALQGFGRTHRSDQAHTPIYKLAMTDLQGHKRFVSSVARRLEQLGALTTGDRQTATKGMFSEKDNLESEYAENAVESLFVRLYSNKLPNFNFGTITKKMGFGQTIGGEWVNSLMDPKTGSINLSKIPTVQQFLNRILSLPFEEQNGLFDVFTRILEQSIEMAKERGTFDPGMQSYKADTIEIKSDEVVWEDPNSSAKTRIVDIETTDPVRFRSLESVQQWAITDPIVKYVQNNQSKRVYALAEAHPRTNQDGTIEPVFRRSGVREGSDYIPEKEFNASKYKTLQSSEVLALWNEEIRTADKIHRTNANFIVGSFLPIWDRIKIASPKIYRFTVNKGEKNGQQVLGALIPPQSLAGVRKRLSAKSGSVTPESAFNSLMNDGKSIRLANNWFIFRVRLSGEYRIEVSDMNYAEANEFVKFIGGYSERIQYRERYFISSNPKTGVEVMTRVLAKSPIVEGEEFGAPGEETAPLPSSTILKPAPVEGHDGFFYRSESDSLRALGFGVVRQIYERRPQATDQELALGILSVTDEDKATRLALDPNENGVPGSVKTILYGELMTRQAAIIANADSTPLARAKATRRLQQMDNVKAPQFTEKGQEISALQQVYKNASAGGIAQYLHEKKKEQERALGGEKGMDDIKAAADELNEVNKQSIEEATKAMNKALRAMPLTKGLWKKYKDWAAQRVFDWLDGVTSPPKELAELDRFTREIVAEVKSRMKAELGDALKQPKQPERSPSDILRDAILNKEKYKEAFDTVLRKLENKLGDTHPIVMQAHQILGAMGVKPWSKHVLDKAIKEAHEAMGLNVREIAKMHYTNADRLHRDLADTLSDIAGIPQAMANDLADDFAKRMQELTIQAKKKAILSIIQRQNSTAKTREKMTAIERAVLLNNYGAMSVPELADLVAKELKLPRVSTEQMQEIARIGNRIETATNMADKARAELDMLRTLRIARGFTRMDVNTSIWYANLLSGYTTQVANVVGNMMTGTLQLATIMATTPKYAGETFRGWINGFGEGWAQGAAIMKTGRGSREFDTNKAGEAGNILELVDFNRDFPDMNERWANARQKHTKALRYVTRMMKAVDSVFYYPAREAFARVAVAKLIEGQYQGKELIDKVREILAISPDQFVNARKRAEAEGFTGIDLVLRTSNIIEEARRKTPEGARAADDSEQFALESTFNNEPVGWAGILYQHLVPLTQSIAPGGVPILRVFLPFLRVPTNLFNASLNFTPVGAMRAVRGMPTEAKRTEDGKYHIERKEFTADERKRLYAQAVGGTLLMAGLAALALTGGDDDKERWFDITSTGPDDFKKRQQLEATGWRPHSIKMGDTWVSYKDSPLLLALAVTGHVVDAVRYSKQNDELALGSKVFNALLTAPRAIMETSMLSGLGQLMEYASGRATAKQLVSFLTRTVSSVVVPNLLQQVDRQFSPAIRDPNGPLGSVGATLPFVRRAGDVKTDVLGETVERNPLARFGGIESNDPLRKLLRDNNIFISTPGRDTKLGNGPMDESTYREYVKISGERIQQRLGQNVEVLRRQPKENVERIVDRITREERERAKNMLRGRAGAN